MEASMTEDERKALRAKNLRLALILASVALAGFLGIILRNWLFPR